MNADDLRSKIDDLLAERCHAERTVADERGRLLAAKSAVEHAEKAQVIVQSVASASQEHAHRRVSSVVTSCLRSVFGEDAPEFRINFREKRGRTEAELVFVDSDGNEMDPTTASGGGLVDVAAFALRVACLSLARPGRRKLLVLDEPFRFVNGEEYQSRVAGMLEKLASDFDLQIIMVTDDDWLQVGRVIRL